MYRRTHTWTYDSFCLSYVFVESTFRVDARHEPASPLKQTRPHRGFTSIPTLARRNGTGGVASTYGISSRRAMSVPTLILP